MRAFLYFIENDECFARFYFVPYLGLYARHELRDIVSTSLKDLFQFIIPVETDISDLFIMLPPELLHQPRLPYLPRAK